MPLAPGDVFAGYTVVRKLGEGGMGAVHLVRHPRLPRLEALKVLRPEYSSDGDFARRFLREAELVAGLEHRNIVPVLDRGEDEGRLWLTMRYVDGTDAETALAGAPGGLLPARRAVRIVGEVAAALDCAHRSNLVHRDVKPANVLLSRPVADEPEQVFLTDFGIARALDAESRLTRTGEVLATLGYASPEQIESLPMDARSDVYSLGCVLHRLLTGSVPFPGESVAAALHGHLVLPPPRPTDQVPWLPPGVDDVVARALAKDPADRYPSCRALAADARAALDRLPALPPAPFWLDLTDAGGTTRLASDTLAPADRDRLTGLLRQNRFFDLPTSLVDGTAAAPAGSGRRVTLVVSGGGRTHRVVADLSAGRRPPELDDLVDTVHELAAAPPARLPEPSTLLELPRQAPLPAVPAPAPPPPVPAAVPRAESSRAAAPRAASAAAPPAARTPAPPTPRPSPAPAPPAGLPAPPTGRRGGLLALALVVALLVAGGVTWLLTRTDDDGDGGGTAGGSTAPPDPAAAALAALPAADPLPDTAVVLAREGAGPADLLAVDTATGATVAVLTTGPGAEVSPVVLPGRRTVVYARATDAGREWRVVAADGTGDRLLFPDGLAGCREPGRPAFDPTDPARLALVCRDEAGTPALRLAGLDGTLGAVLHDGAAVVDDPAWSPDGTRVVLSSGGDPSRDGGSLVVVPVDSPGEATQLTEGDDGEDADPAWSPDGQQLAWRREVVPGLRSIVVGSPDEPGDARIITSGSFDQDPVWSPDGAVIAFKSDRDGDSAPAGDQLWLVDADGSDPRQLPADDGVVVDAPAWADHGS